MIKTFIPLFKIIALLVVTYLLAWGVETAVWPNQSAWVIYLDISMVAAFPIAYRQLKRRTPPKVVWPYAVTMLDGLLPILPYFFVTFALIAPLPQMAAFTWGKTTTGEVQSLVTEQRIDFERSYRVTVTYFSEAGGQWTKNVTIGRKLFAELTEGDVVSIHYLPQWPQQGILADPYLMAAQARLLLWSIFVLTGWFVGAVRKGDDISMV